MSATEWNDFERAHMPERPTLTLREMQEEAEILERYIERQESRLKHAGTRESKLGAEREIVRAERELRELRRYLGSRSVTGSIYGSRSGVREGRVTPSGAAALCASADCRAPISHSEGYTNGGYCNSCLWLWLHPEDREDDPTTRRR